LDTVARTEMVEKELDGMIRRRDEKRRTEEGDRAAEEMYEESCRRYAEQERERNRLAWLDYHRAAAARVRRTLEALISGHEAEAQKLLEEPDGDLPPAA
jgi:Lon protease-like protein